MRALLLLRFTGTTAILLSISESLLLSISEQRLLTDHKADQKREDNEAFHGDSDGVVSNTQEEDR